MRPPARRLWPADDEAPEPTRHPTPRHWSKNRRLWVAVILVAVVLGGGVFGFIKYHQVSGQLAQLRQAQSDREAAAQLAKDYAMKSLTYTFEDPDAFFKTVEDGVSQQLKDKYVSAADVLKTVMLQAQVSSTGEVLAIDPVASARRFLPSGGVGPPNHPQSAEPDAEGVDHPVAGHREQGRQCLAGHRYRPQDRN